METEQKTKSRKKRTIGAPAGKATRIAVAAIGAVLLGGLIYLNRPHNINQKEPTRISQTQEEINKKSWDAFLFRYDKWEKERLPQFISFFNQEPITKEEYSARLEKYREEFPYQLAFNPDMKLEELQTWQEQVRTKFVELLTGSRGFPEKTPLNIKQEPLDELVLRMSQAPYRNYTLGQITYSTRTDRRIRAFIAKPKNIKSGEKLPAILALPGHHGRPENMFMLDVSSIGGIRKDPASFAYRYGHILANQGYIILAPDTSACPYMPDNDNYQAPPPGWLDDGARVWDNIINLDVLCSLPEVDKERVGVYGHSLGGLQALYFAALDKRIKAAVIAGAINAYDSESACKCNIIPKHEQYIRRADLALLLAPDRLIITETGEHDALASSINEGEVIRFGYHALNANQNFIQIMMTGGHAFYGGPETLQKLNSFLMPDIRKTEQEKLKPVSSNNYDHHYFPGNRRQTKTPILTSNNRTEAYDHESNFRK